MYFMTWIIFPCVALTRSWVCCSIRHRVFETVYTTWANQNKVNIVRLYYCIVCSSSLYTSCKCRTNFVSRHFVNLGVNIKCFWVCQSKLRLRSACYKTLHGSSHALPMQLILSFLSSCLMKSFVELLLTLSLLVLLFHSLRSRLSQCKCLEELTVLLLFCKAKLI